MDVATLGIEVRTESAVKAARDLDNLGDQAAVTEKQVKKMATASASSLDNAARGANRFQTALRGPGIRNASLQLSQVAQQTAATGNFVQALAIQLPDLTLGFGTIGIAAGVAAGALLPLIANLVRTEEVSKDMSGQLMSSFRAVKSATDDARNAQERYDLAVQLAGQNRLRVSGEALQALSREARALEALARLERVRLEGQRRELEGRVKSLREQIQAQIDELNQTIGADQNSQFTRTRQEQARLDIVKEVLSANTELVQTVNELQAELDLVNALLTDGRDEAARVIDNLIESNRQAQLLADTNLAGGISNAADEAGRLAFNLANALNLSDNVAAGRIRQGVASGALPPQALDDAPQTTAAAALERRNLDRILADRRARSAGGGRRRSGGGGGGAGVSQRDIFEASQRQTEALKREIQTIGKTRAEVARMEAAWSLLDEAKRAGITVSDEMRTRIESEAEGIGRLTAQLEKAQQEQQAFEELNQSIKDGILDFATEGADAFDSLRDAIKRAAYEFLLFGEGPFAGGGGGLIGGILGGVFGGFRADGGPVLAGRDYIVGERGPEVFRPSTSGQIIPNEALGGTVKVYVMAEEGAMFRPTVRAEAQGVAVQVVSSNNARVAERQRR